MRPILGCVRPLQDTISKQVLSTVPSPPRVRFGTSKRQGMAEKTDAPGPGAYKLKPVMGGRRCTALQLQSMAQLPPRQRSAQKRMRPC